MGHVVQSDGLVHDPGRFRDQQYDTVTEENGFAGLPETRGFEDLPHGGVRRGRCGDDSATLRVRGEKGGREGTEKTKGQTLPRAAGFSEPDVQCEITGARWITAAQGVAQHPGNPQTEDCLVAEANHVNPGTAAGDGCVQRGARDPGWTGYGVQG